MLNASATPEFQRNPFPHTIRVGAVRYELVYYVDPKTADGENVWGEVDHSQAMIKLAGNQTFDHLAVVIVHEVLHCIEHQHRIGLGEKMIHRLAAHFTTLLMDNPELAEAIGEARKIVEAD